jgi:CelD/BcsL family acetyltransferase involved in cellulose biosynthesis
MECQLGSLPEAGRPITPLERNTAAALKACAVLGRRLLKAGRDPLLTLRRLTGDARSTEVTRGTRGPIALQLEAGERVRVKSLHEIAATLDDKGRCGGVGWMRLMEPFCGRSFTVVRRVHRFFDERTRRMLRPRNVVLLGGAYCVPPADGPWDYAGCERMCLLFWHEAWLERVREDEPLPLPLEVQEITTLDALLAVESDWRALVERARSARLFHTWDWLQAQLALYWPSRLAVLLVRRGRDLVGAAPLVLDANGEIGCAGSLSVSESRLDLLYAEQAGVVLEAILAHLRRTRRGFRINLPLCPADSETRLALGTSAVRAGAACLVAEAAPSRVVVAVGGWDAYLASRDHKVCHEWRRKQNKLARAGTAEFRTFTAPEDVSRAMLDVLAVERGSWKEGERTSLGSEDHSAEFYTSLAERSAERDSLRLHVLYLGEKPIAHLLAVRFRDELYALKTSYDLAHAALSPGLLIVLHALRAALGEGCTAVDLLGSDARWKQEVATGVQANLKLCVFTPGQLGCWRCVARERVRSVLGRRAPRLLAATRRMRARLKTGGAQRGGSRPRSGLAG